MRVSRERAQKLVAAHEAAAFTFCCRMVGEPGRAEILAQDALLQCCQGRPDADVRDVLQVAWQLCRRELQQRPAAAERSGFGIQALLLQLPPPERAAIVLRHCLHLSEDYSSAILGQPRSWVRQQVRLGRHRMAGYVVASGLAGEGPLDAAATPPNAALAVS